MGRHPAVQPRLLISFNCIVVCLGCSLPLSAASSLCLPFVVRLRKGFVGHLLALLHEPLVQPIEVALHFVLNGVLVLLNGAADARGLAH
jgi:hypothetical protein